MHLQPRIILIAPLLDVRAVGQLKLMQPGFTARPMHLRIGRLAAHLFCVTLMRLFGVVCT